MRSVCFAAAESGLWSFYYYDGGVWVRRFAGKWGTPSLVAESAERDFCVALRGGGVRLLARSGGALYEYDDETGFAAKRVDGAIGGGCSALGGRLFSVDGTDAGEAFLCRDGERVDRLDERFAGYYCKQDVTDGHCVVFYSPKTPETSVGWREFTINAVGGFRLAYQSSPVWRLADYSFLVTDEAVHMAFVLAGMFTRRVIYRKKNASGLSAPVLLRESPRVGDVLLYIHDGALFAAFADGGRLFTARSDDNGNMFAQAVPYTAKFCANVVKAEFVSSVPLGRLVCREVYADAERPWDVQILPDLWDDFYPSFTTAPISGERAEPETEADGDKGDNGGSNQYDPFAGMSF